MQPCLRVLCVLLQYSIPLSVYSKFWANLKNASFAVEQPHLVWSSYKKLIMINRDSD